VFYYRSERTQVAVSVGSVEHTVEAERAVYSL
jgi:desulfoferrodoxin (superoxide reductase-like protein)